MQMVLCSLKLTGHAKRVETVEHLANDNNYPRDFKHDF